MHFLSISAIIQAKPNPKYEIKFHDVKFILRGVKVHTVLEAISRIGIVPVIAISDVEKAVPLAKALCAGGIPCAEVTFRTAEGEAAMRRIAAEVPEALLGAGTVLTTAQVDRAIAAGAKFVVSPGFNPRVVEYCLNKSVPIVPGCSSPSDMEQAMEYGINTVKFFPAEQAGGLDYIKAVSAPYPGLMFMPTGGIHAGNLAKYLAFEKVVACGGSWMVQKELVSAGRFEEITRLCREAVQVSLGFELAHIGINGQDEEDAKRAARLFSGLFGFPLKEGNNSAFAGASIEVAYAPGRGAHGHIAIGTWSIARAKEHFTRQGVLFDEESVKVNNAGKPVAIYLREEIAGFSIHLLQK